MKKLLIILMLCMFSFVGMGDVLMWEVTDSTKVDNGSIQQFLVPYPSTDDSWPAARVKLVSSDGSSSTILKIWISDEDGVYSWQDGDWGMEIADWESGWGTGVPTGNQSETGYNTIQTIQQQINGETLIYPPEVMEALMIMELGYNSWDESVGDYVWQTIASSAPELYKDLIREHMYASGDVAPPTTKKWNPDFYTMNPPVIPEPSTGLLFLVGASFLALKRRFKVC